MGVKLEGCKLQMALARDQTVRLPLAEEIRRSAFQHKACFGFPYSCCALVPSLQEPEMGSGTGRAMPAPIC